MTSLDIQSILPVFEQNGVAFAGIFGSRARGDNKPESDLDMLIRFRSDDKSLLDIVRIENTLSDKLGCKVDLVIEESLSPYIRDNVNKELKIIYGQR